MNGLTSLCLGFLTCKMGTLSPTELYRDKKDFAQCVNLNKYGILVAIY